MCGIFAAASMAPWAARLVVEGLARLEYRGYDSVGVAALNGGRIEVRKARGQLAEVEARLGLSAIPGRAAIGHTRWATHGEPSDENAHPLLDCSGRVAVAANGIIENHAGLRASLEEAGHMFTSETDTEVLAHLVEEELSRGAGPLEALRLAAARAEGSVAVVALIASGGERVYFYRRGSPLVVGLSGDAAYLSSDIPALLGVAEDILALADGDAGFIEPGRVYIVDAEGRPVAPEERRVRVEWRRDSVSRMGYPHYMLKEIWEQPQALEETLKGLGEAEEVARLIASARRVYATAAGTSLHAVIVFAQLLSRIARIPVHFFVSSEHRAYLPAVEEGDVLLAVTQSGETADTLAAMRDFKAHGARVAALINVPGSAASREADVVAYTRAGPEIAVAATKTFTTQLLMLSATAVYAAGLGGPLTPGEVREAVERLREAPRLVYASLNYSRQWSRTLAARLSSSRSAYYLGRGVGVPLAMEGALKLKEIAYVHAEAYPAGESKHGPIALVEQGFPVVFVSPESSLAGKMAGNIEEMKARGAYTAALAPPRALGDAPVDLLLQLPQAPLHVAPVVYAPPLQLAAYHASVARGLNPDRPRNLAKSVTVE